MWFTESGRAPLPGSRTIAGHCLIWNVPSSVRPAFDEAFLPGSLEWPDDLPLCLNHNKAEPLIRLGPPSASMLMAWGFGSKSMRTLSMMASDTCTEHGTEDIEAGLSRSRPAVSDGIDLAIVHFGQSNVPG